MRALSLFITGVAILAGSGVSAKPAFSSSIIKSESSEIIFCDLDGDGLKDAVLIDDRNLSIFYQDSVRGFNRKPEQQYQLDDRPGILWPARLGGKSESLLVMTSDGISELDFTSRTTPPVCRQIIRQQTIVPETMEETQVMRFPLSADTKTGWPLLLLPVNGGLQIWQHSDQWHQARFITSGVDTRTLPSITNPGYTRSVRLSLSLDDVNHDGRDDLMTMRNLIGGRQVFTLYLQNSNGVFSPEPAMIYTNRANWHTALCWDDLNRDGNLDLIESTISDEPSFVPGLQSGKVLVTVYFGAHGTIPAQPQQVFRKDDWASTLPMVDVDGDGFTDLVLGYIPVNTREGVRNMITADIIKLNLKFHFFRPGVGFAREPDFQRNLSIHFDHQLYFDPTHRFYYERYVTLNGDFNGDGKKDLLVRDESNDISAYFFVSRNAGFNSRPDVQFHCPEPVDWWQIEDLNGDGISDLIVKPQDSDFFRIFISKGK